MKELWDLIDYISRRFPVIGLIGSVVVVVFCTYTMATNISNPLGLLPAGLTLLLILAVTWLVRRAVASLPDPAEPKTAEDVPLGSADEIWDAYRQRREAVHAPPSALAPVSAPEPGRPIRANWTRPLSGPERFNLFIIPGAVGGTLVSLISGVMWFYIENTSGAATQALLNNTAQIVGLCLLPAALLAGGLLGNLGGSITRAIGERLGFRAPALDVITVISAGLTAAVGTLILDAGLWIGAHM